MKKKYKCPCCEYFTLDENPPGTYDICPVCFWEDDPVQFRDHDYLGGANMISLNQAKANFKQISAIDKEFLNCTRKPFKSENINSIGD